MTTKVATFPLRLPVSLKAALETISDRDGASINQFLVVAAAEKIATMQTEEFFLTRRNRADREAFRRLLNRAGGEAPGTEDQWSESDASPRDAH
jgi:hypothetical protein